MIDKEFNLQDIPKKGDKAVAEFAYSLFDIANQEKIRLKKNEDFLANYSLFRGKSQLSVSSIQSSSSVNLLFSNIERTVANITARRPVGEVVDLDGYEDDAENILSMVLQKWWRQTNQQVKTKETARTMEVYGITIEKPHWDKLQARPGIMLTDPFAFFPAPGNWENIAEEAPYVCFAYLDFVDKVEKDFNVTGVAQEDAYELLGAVREEYQANIQQKAAGNYADKLISARQKSSDVHDKKIERCLIIEVWLRDTRTHKIETQILDEEGMPAVDTESGEALYEEKTVQIYPDGVRKITITRGKGDLKSKSKARTDYIILDDSANPNINPVLEVQAASATYPWGRLPVYTANSYKDLVSIWGFAAAEQVGDLLIKINRIISKLVNYVVNVMAPPLIVQQHCGITRAMIEESITKGGRLVLMPTTPNARIEFMQIPNLPATFFQVLDLVVRFFDRLYATEEADRGEAPKGVIAASAIVALQERNQVLMQAKTTAIEKIAEERSRWAIGLYQNFGTKTDLVKVADEMIPFIGVNYAGREFGYVIESGSTTPRTSLALQELTLKLAEMKLVDQRAVLETLNIPNWKEIIERTGETQLDMALQVLIDAGMPEEEAVELKQYLMQPDQGPGGEKTKSTEAKRSKTGIPKAQQGRAV